MTGHMTGPGRGKGQSQSPQAPRPLRQAGRLMRNEGAQLERSNADKSEEACFCALGEARLLAVPSPHHGQMGGWEWHGLRLLPSTEKEWRPPVMTVVDADVSECTDRWQPPVDLQTHTAFGSLWTLARKGRPMVWVPQQDRTVHGPVVITRLSSALCSIARARACHAW